MSPQIDAWLKARRCSKRGGLSRMPHQPTLITECAFALAVFTWHNKDLNDLLSLKFCTGNEIIDVLKGLHLSVLHLVLKTLGQPVEVRCLFAAESGQQSSLEQRGRGEREASSCNPTTRHWRGFPQRLTSHSGACDINVVYLIIDFFASHPQTVVVAVGSQLWSHLFKPGSEAVRTQAGAAG